jgi:hypothetical protein
MARTPKGWIAAAVTRISGKARQERRRRTLSSIDWVIRMLRQVREDKPQASARWWDSMREAVLKERASRARDEGPPKAH